MTARKKTATQSNQAKSSSDIDAKILDERLKAFASGDSSRRRTVIIRLDVPEPRLKIGKKRSIGTTRLPKKRLTLTESQQRERKQKTLQFKQNLQTSGIENTPLYAGAFVAKVDPEQLRSIAQSDLTKAIIPNRKYDIR